MFRRVVLRLFPTSSTAALLRLCALAALCLGLASVLPALASAAAYSPVAEYSFDEVKTEGETETVEDLSGEGHTATVHGAEWTPKGRYGGAMEFDGAKGDYLSIPASEELDQTAEEFTIEAWVRPTATPSRAAILTKERAGAGPHYSYSLIQHEEEPLGEFMESEEGLLEGDEDAVPPDAWTHLTITDDGAYLRLYVNGELEDTSAAVAVEGDGELRIGGNGIGGEYFTGRIDEVRIYDRVLGQAELATDMETPIQTPKAGPVADWSFDADPGEGTTTEDGTGHGHTATIHGAKWSSHGKYGGAMEFKEGTYLSVPASPELDLTEEFTLEAWIHPETKHEFDSILTKESAEESKFAYLIADHHGQFATYYGKYGHAYYSPGEEIKTHSWTHVAVVDDGARIHLYLDGEEVESGPAFEIISTAGNELRIGSSRLLEDFIGRIDEVRIYGRALNEGEVANDMEAPIQTPKAGPVAAYSFDEGEAGGETVEDVTGDGHTATIEDGIRISGRYGGGIGFDGGGGNECVSVPDSPELHLTEEFTLEAWVKPVGGVYEDPVVVREAGSKDAFGLGLGSRKEFAPEGFIGQGKGSEAAYDGEVRANEWTPIATTYDGSKIRVYEEGVLVAEKTALTPPVTGEGPLKIGCDGPDGQFTGGIDEVSVYNRALTAAEVAAGAEMPLQTPKSGPVASYSFDEDNEETAADASGNGHTATVEGATWTANGRYGGAMEFEASKEDVLKIPASPQLDLDEGFTLEAWVRPSGGDNHSAPLIDKQKGSGHGYFLYEGGSVSDRPAGAASEDQELVHADDPLPARTWSHVALVFTGGRTYLYVDGELVDNGAAEPVVTEEGELEIGGSTDTSDYFDGRIDEVRVYGRGLSPAEVATDMEAPIQTPKHGPIAAWTFDELEGSTAEDMTGDGHTATIEGAIPARGKYGEGLQFDGENDVLKVPNSPEFALVEGFTLESWVRPESQSNEWAPILAKAVGGGKAAHELAYWLYEGGHEPNVPFGGTEPSAGKRNEALGEDPLPVNAWSHVALTYDGSQVILYVNGELVDCSEAPSAAPRVTEGELQIGGATEHGAYFKGRLDEVRIYNRALNAAEVVASMGPLPYAKTEAAYGVEEGEGVFAAELNPRGEETDFRFEYGPTTAYGQSVPEPGEPNEVPESGEENTEVEEVADGLEPETTYHFRIVASNSLGTVVGRDQTLTTGPAEESLEAFAVPHEPASFYGTNWNGSVNPVEQDRDVNLTDEAGARFFRIPIGNTSGAAELFLHAAERHVKLLPNIVGIAGATFEGGTVPGNTIPPLSGSKEGVKNMEKWEGELEGLLERFGPEGTFWKSKSKEIAEYAPEWWEIWNEPNWGAQGTSGKNKIDPARFGELLAGSRRAFNAVNGKRKENAMILFGGVLAVGPRLSKKEREEKEKKGEKIETDHMRLGAFIKAVGHFGDYDGVSVHPYAFSGVHGDTPHEDKGAKEGAKEKDAEKVTEKVMKNLRVARGSMEVVRGEFNAGREEKDKVGKKPIWVTEIGWPVDGHGVYNDGSHLPVSENMQAKLLEHSFDAIKTKAAHLDITKLLYYNMSDNTEISGHPSIQDIREKGPANWANHCGLVEDHDGWGKEQGHDREALTAFEDEIK
jgi:hypothetical protein